MKFSDLRDAVHDMWEFVWPPVVSLSLFVALATYVAPNQVRSLSAGFPSFSIVGREIRGLRVVLKDLSLDAVLPLAGAFAVVFILYLTRRLIISLGAFVPPSIGYRTDVLLTRTATDQQLTRFWAAVPNALDLSDVHRALEQRVHTEKCERLLPDYWQKRAGARYQMFGVCKLLLLWVVLCACVERTVMSTERATVAVLVLFMLAAGLLLLYLYALEQDSYIRVIAYQTVLASAQPVDNEPKALSATQAAQVLDARERDSWWAFSVPPVNYVRWLRYRFREWRSNRQLARGPTPGRS